MLVLLILILFSFQASMAQHSILSSAVHTSSRGIANGGVCTWDPTSGYLNPAHLGFISHHTFAMDAFNYYFIKDLYTLATYGAWKVNPYSGFGFSLMSDGSSDLKEWLATVSYGRKLMEHTSIGMSLDYLRTQTPESPDRQNIAFEIGIQTKLTSNLLAGMIIKNPIPLKLHDLNTYPAIFKFGINYKVHDQFQVLAELHKYGTHNASVIIGLHYFPVTYISFTTGVHSSGPVYSFGLNYMMENRITLSTSFQQHVVLGSSPSFGLNYSFK
jgi:hypothetical protein